MDGITPRLITSNDPLKIYAAPYFTEVPLFDAIGPAIEDYLNVWLPVLLPPYIDPAAEAAVQAIALLRAGDTATGPIFTTQTLPQFDNEFATKLYVDTIAGTVSAGIYQGVWNPATNVPDLMNPPPLDQYQWICAPVPRGGVVITAVLPGLTGQRVNSGDHIIWINNVAQFGIVPAGDLSYDQSLTLFLPLAGGALSGGLSIPTAGGLNFGTFSQGGAGTYNLSRHITLYGPPANPANTAIGFNITGGGTDLNAILPANGLFRILAGTTTMPASFSAAGILFEADVGVGLTNGTARLFLVADPTAPMQAATKQYVDALGTGPFLPLTGGVISGNLTINGDTSFGDPAFANNIAGGFRSRGWGTDYADLCSETNALRLWMGAPASTVLMSLDGTGTLRVLNGIWCNAADDFGLFVDNASGNRYTQYTADWYDAWVAANGTRVWGHGATALMVLTAGADLDVTGNIVSVLGTGIKTGGGPWDPPASDARIKQNIVPYTTGLAEVVQLEPKVYSYIPETGFNPTARYIGLIAQDVQPIMPEMIMAAPAQHPIGTVDIPDLISMSLNALTYALINAVKELAARVVALEGTP